ncbi:MAG TPA: urea ABC transporter permease subunit UrtC [Planctomycetota bacterium]|nr:urea ABC transporter permease subunit UrtC [Planctomycetota bacterium]
MFKSLSSLNRYGAWIAFFFALVVVPSLYFENLISIGKIALYGKFLAYVVVAIGVDLVWGYTGILSLCQAMFFCMGAYAMGMYFSFHGQLDARGVPYCLSYVSSEVHKVNGEIVVGSLIPWFWEPFRYFPVALILGVTFPAAIAAIFGFFAFRSRVRGVYFSIITQAITLAAVQFFMLNNMRLGGTNGIRLIQLQPFMGMDLYQPSGVMGMYIISALTVAAVYAFSRHLVNSRLGRILIAIRDNESRLRFSGYQPAYYKLFIFAFAAAIGGIGGMLYIPQDQIVTPANMDALPSILMVVWVALGGRGTLSGAVVGTLAVNILYSYMTSKWPQYWPFVLGGIAIFVVLFFPQGIVGMWRQFTGNKEDAPPIPHATADGAEVAA